MADFRSLIIDAGLVKQVQDGDRIVAPSGVISTAAALALLGAQGFGASLSAEQAAVETAGSIVSVTGTQGGDSAGGGAGGAGGPANVTGGRGGAGDGANAAGAGAAANLVGGDGGTDNGGGGGASGGARVDSGAATGAAANGAVLIGDTNAASIGVGRVGITSTFSGLAAFVLDDNTAGVFSISDGTNSLVNIDSTTGSETITFGVSAQPVIWQSVIPDNSASAFVVSESGVNLYFQIVTTNGSEVVRFGNATTNPEYSFEGTGIARYDGAIHQEGTTATTGYHEFAESADPATPTDAGRIYVKDDAGDSELFYIDAAGNVVQITLDGSVNASSGPPTYTGTADEAINAFALVSHDDAGAGSGQVRNANATNGSGVLSNAVGFSTGAAAQDATVTIQVAGQVTIPDSQWATPPTATEIGQPVFMHTIAGQVTLTAPVPLNVSKIVGYVSFADGAADTSRVAIQMQTGIQL